MPCHTLGLARTLGDVPRQPTCESTLTSRWGNFAINGSRYTAKNVMIVSLLCSWLTNPPFSGWLSKFWQPKQQFAYLCLLCTAVLMSHSTRMASGFEFSRVNDIWWPERQRVTPNVMCFTHVPLFHSHNICIWHGSHKIDNYLWIDFEKVKSHQRHKHVANTIHLHYFKTTKCQYIPVTDFCALALSASC